MVGVMGINPFALPFPRGQQCPQRSVYVDEAGQAWDVEYSHEQDCYILARGEHRRYASRDWARNVGMLGELPSSWRTPLTSRVTRASLVANRDWRWRKHMVRIQDKVTQKRLAHAIRFGIMLAWLWGVMLSLAATIMFLKLLGWMVLGT